MQRCSLNISCLAPWLICPLPAPFALQLFEKFRPGEKAPAALGASRDYNVDLVPKFIMVRTFKTYLFHFWQSLKKHCPAPSVPPRALHISVPILSFCSLMATWFASSSTLTSPSILNLKQWMVPLCYKRDE